MGLSIPLRCAKASLSMMAPPFTSADVVATFNRIINPPEGIISQFRNDFLPWWKALRPLTT